jgi:hydrogenase expression/formation protein HypE
MIRAVLFDFDGTLTRPEAIDFDALRALLGCPAGTAILEYIDSLPTEAARREAHRTLDGFEKAAARASVPNNGAEELIELLRARGYKIGILTRNSMASILEALKNFRMVTPGHFGAILTRENSGRPKPHPDGVLAAAGILAVETAEMLVVGDFVFDIAAGQAAGARTALLTNSGSAPEARIGSAAPRAPAPTRIHGIAGEIEAVPNYTIRELAELRGILGL